MLGQMDASWVVRQGPVATTGNAIELLIDNEVAWARLADEIAGAKRSIRAMLFMLDAPHVRMSFDARGSGLPGGSVRLEERLLQAAGRGVDVAVLLNHVLPSISPANTTRAVERFFRRHDSTGRVHLARFRTPQAAPIHAKVFVIDDRVGFLVGSAFAQEYFDGRDHRIDDPRRGRLRWRSAVMAPVHDVSARIEGPAVADLDATFRLHWQLARGAAPDLAAPPAGDPGVADPRQPPGRIPMQVTRTLHGSRYPGMPAGETGVYESYLRALETARDFVYVETQYLTCLELIDGIVAAMLRNPGLELIALINMRLDIPGYTAWQREAIERLFAGLGDQSERAGLFTLWSHEGAGANGGGSTILRNHVHSKLAIIDDAWLTIGSANLDGTSLVAGEHARRWPIRAALWRLVGAFGDGNLTTDRSTEVNVTCAGLPGSPPPAEIARLRRDLWAEHLGFGAGPGFGESPALARRPDGGWLQLWRERADLKLTGLMAADPRVETPRVLPYPARDGRVPSGIERADVYLRALGVNVARIDVRHRFRSFPLPEAAPTAADR